MPSADKPTILVEFQYISCYSLSESAKEADTPAPMFQYISCYSLSVYVDSVISLIEVSIHLMLLFIKNNNIYDKTKTCFNTSHVTLYHDCLIQDDLKVLFQYISCYSLSKLQSI